MLIPDFDLSDGGASYRTGMVEPLVATDHAHRLALGTAVHLPDPLGAQPVDPRPFEPGRTRRGHVEHDLDRAHVAARPLSDRQPPDPLHHRGHQVAPADPVLLDEIEHTARVEAGHQHHVAPAQEAVDGDGERCAVRQRCRHQHRAAVGQTHELRGGTGVLGDRGLARHDQLRSAGATTAGDDLPDRGHLGRPGFAAPGSNRRPHLVRRDGRALRPGLSHDQDR